METLSTSEQNKILAVIPYAEIFGSRARPVSISIKLRWIWMHYKVVIILLLLIIIAYFYYKKYGNRSLPKSYVMF
jgi:hypothetical protein